MSGFLGCLDDFFFFMYSGCLEAARCLVNVIWVLFRGCCRNTMMVSFGGVRMSPFLARCQDSFRTMSGCLDVFWVLSGCLVALICCIVNVVES